MVAHGGSWCGRLGLPGCGSPGRDGPEDAAVDAALTLGPSPATAHASHRGGAKRGFADSLDGSAAWAAGEEDKKKGEAAAAGADAAAAEAQEVAAGEEGEYEEELARLSLPISQKVRADTGNRGNQWDLMGRYLQVLCPLLHPPPQP